MDTASLIVDWIWEDRNFVGGELMAEKEAALRFARSRLMVSRRKPGSCSFSGTREDQDWTSFGRGAPDRKASSIRRLRT